MLDNGPIESYVYVLHTGGGTEHVGIGGIGGGGGIVWLAGGSGFGDGGSTYKQHRDRQDNHHGVHDKC
jgi:hypothetical protein